MGPKGWNHTPKPTSLIGADMGISSEWVMYSASGWVEAPSRGYRTPSQVTHLAAIMDGNRRFAWKSKLATGLGHRIGKQKLETVLDWVLELDIPWFTVYAIY